MDEAIRNVLKEKEAEFQNDLEYWKRRCLQNEARVDQILSQKGNEANSSNPSPKVGNNLVSPSPDNLQLLNNESKVIRQGLADMEKRVCRWVQDLSEQHQISEQYQKKNNIIIRGYRYNLPNMNNLDFIQATANELNNLFPSLNGQVLPIHIDDAHPLANKKTVIVKFSNRWVKNEIMRCKGDLQNSCLYVTEHLTPHTLKLIDSAKKLVGNENVWVHNTLVFARYLDTRYAIRSTRDLELLKKAVEPLPQVSQAESNANTAVPVPTPELSPSTEYMINYPALYNSLNYNNNSQPIRGGERQMRGKPSRNGRGRGQYKNTY